MIKSKTKTIGARVKINKNAGEFADFTGFIENIEKIGSQKLFRIRFPRPIEIDGVGIVKSDLFETKYFHVF